MVRIVERPTGSPAVGLDAPVYEVMRTMRVIRRLRPDPVPHELLQQLVESATWAPSGSNAQSFSWIIVTDRATMRSLASLWARCFELYTGTVGGLPVDTLDESPQARVLRASIHQRDHFADTPALVVPCYDLAGQRAGLARAWRSVIHEVAKLDRPDRAAFIRSARRSGEMAEAASVYPGVQNLLLTARALGLGATLTTWHLLLEQQFKRVLGVPRTVKTFAAIPVGWPAGKFGPVRRRPAADAIRWERW